MRPLTIPAVLLPSHGLLSFGQKPLLTAHPQQSWQQWRRSFKGGRQWNILPRGPGVIPGMNDHFSPTVRDLTNLNMACGSWRSKESILRAQKP